MSKKPMQTYEHSNFLCLDLVFKIEKNSEF